MAEIGTGRVTITGIKNGAAWFTAVAVAANHGVFADISEIALPSTIVPINTPGQFFMRQMKRTDDLPAPTITFPLQRTGALWIPVAQLFGAETKAGAGPWTHTWGFQDEARKFFTLAARIADGGPVIEWPSVKPIAFELSPGPEGIAQIVVETIADTMLVTGDTGIVNTDSDFDTLTYVDDDIYVLAREFALQINADGGAALGSGDEVELIDYRLRVARPMDRRPLVSGASTGQERMTSEPLQNAGYPEILLGFDVDRIDDTNYPTISELTDYGTTKKALITATATISTVAYIIRFEMALLQKIEPTAALSGGNNIPLSMQYRALERSANPTGMSHLHAQGFLQDNYDQDLLAL